MAIKVWGKGISRLLQAYYLFGPEHPMKRRFWAWLRKASSYPRLTIPYAQRGWITVDDRDLVQRHILQNGLYEPQVWQALAAFIKADEVVWDVGAYTGSFSIQAILDARVRQVYAFEPDPISAEILAVNLALNKSKYIIHRLALSNQREKRDLCHGPIENSGLSSLSFKSSSQIFEVDCCSTDELVFQEHMLAPTLMKIDVEAWEPQVFSGAKRTLTEFPPKAIVFEAICGDASGKLTQRSSLPYLEGFGYKIYQIEWPQGIIEQRGNFLAVHKRYLTQASPNLKPI